MQFQKLQYGAIGIGTKISGFFLELLDPTLFGHYISCTANIPKQHKVDTVRNANWKDCFSYRALNFNTHTEDHRDSGDHKRRVAELQISGDFTGGDFILRDIKQMFELLPGSQGFVRGPVQSHCTRAWSGDSRFCQVMTVKHSVWLEYPPTGLQEEPEVDEKGPKKRKRGPEDGKNPASGYTCRRTQPILVDTVNTLATECCTMVGEEKLRKAVSKVTESGSAKAMIDPTVIRNSSYNFS